MSDTNRSVWSC